MTERPVLITDAPESADAELDHRRRRYLLTMGLRIPLLIGAGAFYQTPWLAITLVVLSVPLPWVAVLVANDRPARGSKRHQVLPGTISYDRALENPSRVIDVIDSDPDVTGDAGGSSAASSPR